MARIGVGTGLAAIFLVMALFGSTAPGVAGCGRLSCGPQSFPSLKPARSEYGHIYGALAYSKRDGAYGWSTSYDDSDSANEAALETCREHGRGCYVVISFSNLCAAVVADDDEGVFWGTAGTRLEAEHQALLYCRRNGSDNCQVKVWACSIP